MALDLTAVNQNIQFSTVASQNNLTTITIASWIRPDSKGFDSDPYGRIFQKNSRFAFYVDGDVSPTFGFSSGWSGSNGDWGADYGSLGSFGTLHHVAVTYDASSSANDPILYLNGVAQSLGAYNSNPSGSIDADGSTISLGSTVSGSGDYDGLLAEEGFWNRILSPAEVKALSQGFSPLFMLRGLVFYTPLLGRRNPERDFINGITGTFSGSPSTVPHPRIIYPTMQQIRRFGGDAPVSPDVEDFLTMLGVS